MHYICIDKHHQDPCNMAPTKKIPYGVSNFERLRSDNYYYVDKTKHIEILENFNEPYICFFRPRRFGKSLFVSMLSNYYDKTKAKCFDKTFKDLYIGKNPTALKNSYSVLHFNFSGINIQNKDSIEHIFNLSVLKSLRVFIHDYMPDYKLDASLDASSMLNLLLGEAQIKLNNKIYVIIDEYDHFTSELLGYNKSLFDEVVSRSGFFRKFFEVLKIGTEDIIDRIFFTGVNPLTLDSLTSGFNISSNLTLSPKLHEMMGFNEAEIETLFAHYGITGNDFDKLLPMLKAHYDGYIFVDEPANHLYNSDMVLYFAKDYLEERKPPRNLIDENIASSYAKIKRFIELGDYEQNIAFIRGLLEGKEVNLVLTTRFEPSQRFTADDFKSLFFYMGLVTIRSGGLRGFSVKIPNYVIKELYFTFFESILEQQSNYRTDITGITNAIADLAEFGRMDALIGLCEGRLKKLSKRDFIRFDEKYVKLIMLNYLYLSQIYFIKSEYEVEGGYIDIALLPRLNKKAPKHAIIELKYIPKEHFTEKLLEEKISEGKAQLARYTTSEELMQVPNLLKFVVVFKGDECVFAESVELIN
jgi:hypothetical protein